MASLLVTLLVTGACDTSLLDTKIQGELSYTGNVPLEQVTLKVRIYEYMSNRDAMVPENCPSGEGVSEVATGAVPDCYGTLVVDRLGAPASARLTWTPGAKTFILEEVPLDVGYIVIVEPTAADARCNADILGYDEQTKLVTKGSLISPVKSGSLFRSGKIHLPRPARISCDAVEAAEAGEPPPPVTHDPATTDDTVETEEGDLPAPLDPRWTQFQLKDSDGTVVADASGESVVGDDNMRPCGESEPHYAWGAIADYDGDVAYIHVQEGKGDRAVVRDQMVAVVDGEFKAQAIQVSGGYARIQLDTDPIDGTDFSNASHFIEVCRSDDIFDWPQQELLVVTSWNTPDTDVDSHAWVGEEDHIWYARKEGDNGTLDVDDVDGYGPETITSNPGVAGATFDVKIHYYSDHGNAEPPTDVTVRVIYAQQQAGVFCDNTTVVTNFQAYEWRVIGRYGPELAEMATSEAARFEALGCTMM